MRSICDRWNKRPWNSIDMAVEYLSTSLVKPKDDEQWAQNMTHLPAMDHALWIEMGRVDRERQEQGSHGIKGGRPEIRPPSDEHLFSRYKHHQFILDTPYKAWAAVVNELVKERKVSAGTARNWVANAKQRKS